MVMTAIAIDSYRRRWPHRVTLMYGDFRPRPEDVPDLGASWVERRGFRTFGFDLPHVAADFAATWRERVVESTVT
jgi:hypothetical protein